MDRFDAVVAEVEETGGVFTVVRDGRPVAVVISWNEWRRLTAELEQA